MINSVLARGAWSNVSSAGSLSGSCQNLWMIGISKDGQIVRAKVNEDTGRFVLRLRTRTAWALALCRAVQEEGGQWRMHIMATLRFRLDADDETNVLPLMLLARREMNLGDLDVVQNRLQAHETIQGCLV